MGKLTKYDIIRGVLILILGNIGTFLYDVTTTQILGLSLSVFMFYFGMVSIFAILMQRVFIVMNLKSKYVDVRIGYVSSSIRQIHLYLAICACFGISLWYLFSFGIIVTFVALVHWIFTKVNYKNVFLRWWWFTGLIFSYKSVFDSVVFDSKTSLLSVTLTALAWALCGLYGKHMYETWQFDDIDSEPVETGGEYLGLTRNDTFLSFISSLYYGFGGVKIIFLETNHMLVFAITKDRMEWAVNIKKGQDSISKYWLRENIKFIKVKAMSRSQFVKQCFNMVGNRWRINMHCSQMVSLLLFKNKVKIITKLSSITTKRINRLCY